MESLVTQRRRTTGQTDIQQPTPQMLGRRRYGEGGGSWMSRQSSSLPTLLLLFLFLFLMVVLFNSVWPDASEAPNVRRGQKKEDVLQVVVVGAGAAGLSAAHTLKMHGYERVVILEASNGFGGRVRKDSTFTDYPVDLGGTFVYDKEALKHIAGKDVYDKLAAVDCEHTHVLEVGRKEIRESTFKEHFMWVNNTWYDFFADYMAPKHPSQEIVYGCPVDNVNYQDKTVKVACGDRTFVANHAIITVPLSVLQDNDIAFTPSLPEDITVGRAKFMPGFKIFIEFKERFYWDSFVWEEDSDCPTSSDEAVCVSEELFWDYSMLQNTTKHVVGGYMIGTASGDLVDMNESDILKFIMKRFDGVFEGKASKYYLNHKVINWSKEPFIRGAYSNMYQKIGVPNVQDRIFIAGEAFPLDGRSYGWVHGAALSGKSAAHKILLLGGIGKKLKLHKFKVDWGFYSFDELVMQGIVLRHVNP